MKDANYWAARDEAFSYMTPAERQEVINEEKCLKLCKVLSHGHGMHHPECPFFLEPMPRD